MTDNFIQLNKSNILRLGIKDENGNILDGVLEFDLEDIELPLRYQELLEQDKKNREHLRNQMLMIDRKQDVKGKKLMSKNEEDKMKAITEFFKKETEIYDMFLGEGGINKLLNGRKLGWTSLDDITEIIVKQISPHLDLTMSNITDKIKSKYGEALKRNKEVLKDEE